ncbi:hypothetical protein KP509_33G001600 [Ceratopteris richardii]|nr:hypothetical protein KP509_33G001600 [Ceratopteris richardii]
MRDPPLICSSCRTKRVFLLNALLFHDSCRKLGGLSSPDKLVGDLTGAAANTSVCQQQLGFDHPQILLVAVDGTWQHAREMIKASASYLDDFVIPVCLPFDVEKDGSCMADSDSLLRKEPFKGCMTTLEAISCCLKILEPNGTRLHEQLLHTLKCMVQFQASNVVVHKVRMQNNKL